MGMSLPVASVNFMLESTLLAGRLAGRGKFSVVTGLTWVDRPANSMVFLARSYHEALPRLQMW
jgi:hypothetical protein